MAHKVARSKTYIDNAGKDLVTELKALPKQIDESRRIVRERLDALKDEVRRPLTEWEQAEESRKNALQQRLNDLRALGDVMSADGNYLPSVDIQARIIQAKSFLLMIAGKKSPPKLA
jgi:chromosome condensin MukBEF complex kleisin-like MukF subunit